jgi:hypothetical protein
MLIPGSLQRPASRTTAPAEPRTSRGVVRLLVSLALAACGEGTGDGVDAGVDAAPHGQGSPPAGELVVNEVAPRSDGADWFELANRTEQPVDLCDYYVTDGLDRLDHYLPLVPVESSDRCPARWLAPGEKLVVVADDDAAAGPDHAPFALGVADEVHVVRRTGLVVDSFLYLYPAGGDGRTLARCPDGEGLFFLAEPSPGAANPEAAP